MSKKLRELQAKKAAAAEAKKTSLQAAAGVLDKASAESRDMTDAEHNEFNGHRAAADAKTAEIERLQASIDIEQETIAANAHAGSVVLIAGNGTDVSVNENSDKDPKAGFKSFGEYARSVHFAGLPGNSPDQRLVPLRGASAPGVYGGEGTGADGGFLIPPEFSKDIFQLSLGDDALLPMTDNINVQGNAMAFPKDETTPWGTDGIQAYWQGEAIAAQAAKPKLGVNALRLKKLMALVPVSDELLEDSTALTAYLPKKVAAKIQWKTNEAILFGAGGGLPLGALQGAAAIVVAKDNGQAAGTVSATNISNMVSRLPGGSFKTSIWIINPDVLPGLDTLTIGSYPIYLPTGAGGVPFAAAPYGMLRGRPVLVSEHANGLGLQGDINLVDLSYYQTITKEGGIATATSMHLYFDADAAAFRTIFRMDGQPKLSAPITPPKSNNKRSPFIQLAAR